ncbi:MAG: class I SAM-dependent methyltransferase, partial [Patescibacteria group bacterium]
MKYTGERMMPEYNEGEDMYLEHFARYFFAAQFVKNKNVLDIACGSGYGSQHLLNSGAKKIIGVDISAETINYCKEKYQADNLNFLIGDVKRIPQENNSVDIVVSFETIEHVDKDSQIKFIEEIKRVLTPDGLFIVSTPNSLVHPKGNHFHIHELDFEEFKNILNKNFENVNFFYQDTVESSYIYSEERLRKKIKDDNKKFRLNEKTSEMSARKSMYIVAVCSDKKFEDINELVCLSDIKPYLNLAKKNEEIKYFNLDLNKKNEEIRSLNLNLNKKSEEVESLNL